MAKPRRQGLLAAIGWREWVALPELGIRAVKVKVDTGARSSSLHAINVEPFERQGLAMVRFQVHPWQRSAKKTVSAEAELLGLRQVRNSGGQQTLRPVIATEVELAGQRWRIELTLSSRDEMGFRMLLGRQALRGRFAVDPGKSYVAGGKSRRKKRKPKTSKRNHEKLEGHEKGRTP